MFERLIAIALVVLLVLIAAQPVRAEPAVSVRTSYYEITGTTSAELKSQMQSRGPHGFWAYTTWHVRWTGDCHVSLEISYTYPKWTNQNEAPASLRQAWTHMISRLQLHESGHGQHGKNAAAEIERSRCSGESQSIIQKWAAQDKIYDDQTNHGRAQGAVLP